MKRLAALCLACLVPLVVVAQSKRFDSKPLAITGVTVIDTTGAPSKPDQTVVVEGNRISQVGEEKKMHAPKGAQVVNGRGMFIIPGLWDMHVHVRDAGRAFPLFIANGVLGVRDMGGRLDDLKRWRAQVVSDELLGPHLVISGPALDGASAAQPDLFVAVHDPAEARAAVDKLKEGGVDFISVAANLTPDEYRAIAEESKKLPLPFAGNLPQGIWASEASTAGQLSIEHLDGSLAEASQNFDQIVHLADSQPNGVSEDPGATLSALKLEAGSLDPQRLKILATLLAKNGTWQVPTLTAAKAMAFLNEETSLSDSRLSYLTPKERQEWSDLRERRMKANSPEFWALLRSAYDEKLAITREYHRDGVSILGGSDAGGPAPVVPGFALHDELAALVAAGFTPLEALQSVTLNAADFLGRSDDYGAVANGKAADFVLLDANPLDDIRNTQKIRAVVFEGKYLDRAALDALIAHAK